MTAGKFDLELFPELKKFIETHPDNLENMAGEFILFEYYDFPENSNIVSYSLIEIITEIGFYRYNLTNHLAFVLTQLNDRSKYKVAMCNVVTHGGLEMLELLLQAPVAHELINEGFPELLECALKRGQDAIIDRLLEIDTLYNVLKADGHFLRAAVQSGRNELVTRLLMLEGHAYTPLDCYNALIDAVLLGNVRITEHFFAISEVREIAVTFEREDSLLHHAICAGYYSVVAFLLNKEVIRTNLDTLKFVMTPAIISGNNFIVEELFAIPELAQSVAADDTMIDCIIEHNRPEFFQLFLEHPEFQRVVHQYIDRVIELILQKDNPLFVIALSETPLMFDLFYQLLWPLILKRNAAGLFSGLKNLEATRDLVTANLWTTFFAILNDCSPEILREFLQLDYVQNNEDFCLNFAWRIVKSAPFPLGVLQVILTVPYYRQYFGALGNAALQIALEMKNAQLALWLTNQPGVHNSPLPADITSVNARFLMNFSYGFIMISNQCHRFTDQGIRIVIDRFVEQQMEKLQNHYSVWRHYDLSPGEVHYYFQLALEVCRANLRIERAAANDLVFMFSRFPAVRRQALQVHNIRGENLMLRAAFEVGNINIMKILLSAPEILNSFWENKQAISLLVQSRVNENEVCIKFARDLADVRDHMLTLQTTAIMNNKSAIKLARRSITAIEEFIKSWAGSSTALRDTGNGNATVVSELKRFCDGVHFMLEGQFYEAWIRFSNNFRVDEIQCIVNFMIEVILMNMLNTNFLTFEEKNTFMCAMAWYGSTNTNGACFKHAFNKLVTEATHRASAGKQYFVVSYHDLLQVARKTLRKNCLSLSNSAARLYHILMQPAYYGYAEVAELFSIPEFALEMRCTYHGVRDLRILEDILLFPAINTREEGACIIDLVTGEVSPGQIVNESIMLYMMFAKNVISATLQRAVVAKSVALLNSVAPVSKAMFEVTIANLDRMTVLGNLPRDSYAQQASRLLTAAYNFMNHHYHEAVEQLMPFFTAEDCRSHAKRILHDIVSNDITLAGGIATGMLREIEGYLGADNPLCRRLYQAARELSAAEFIYSASIHIVERLDDPTISAEESRFLNNYLQQYNGIIVQHPGPLPLPQPVVMPVAAPVPAPAQPDAQLFSNLMHFNWGQEAGAETGDNELFELFDPTEFPDPPSDTPSIF